MADAKKVDKAQLMTTFKAYCALEKKPEQMTSKACNKMAAECIDTKYPKYKISSGVDISIFPKCKKEGKLKVTDANIMFFMNTCAVYAAGQMGIKKKDNEKQFQDYVDKVEAELVTCICESKGPKVTGTKQSATGNVDGMTDTSKYTGAHKERFGEDGKGKGIDGRVDKTNNSGYVGNYKGDGTYDRK